MIIDEKKALSCCKNSNALLRGITSNHIRYFYCINGLHSFRTENKLKKHENDAKIMTVVM